MSWYCSGRLEVAVIANASIDDFQLNADASSFLATQHAKVPRTRYTTYMSQRRAAPAKNFRSQKPQTVK